MLINETLVETTEPPFTPTPDWIRSIYSIYLIVIIAVGLPGNIIIAIIYGRQVPKSACDWLIFTMGVTDAVVCLFSPILNLRLEFEAEIPGMNGVWCRLEYWLHITAMLASLIILVVIALDRYIKICRPTLQSLTPLMARHVCWWTVLVSGALCVYPSSGSFEDDICLQHIPTQKDTMKIYFTCVFCGFVISFIVVTFAYFSVCKQIGEKIKIKQRLLDNDGVTSNMSFQEASQNKKPLGALLIDCCKLRRTWHSDKKPCKTFTEDDECATFLNSKASPKINVDQAESDSNEVFVNQDDFSSTVETQHLRLLSPQPRLQKMFAIDYDQDTETTHLAADDLCPGDINVQPSSHIQHDVTSVPCEDVRATNKTVEEKDASKPPSVEQPVHTDSPDLTRFVPQGNGFNRGNFILNSGRNGCEHLIYYRCLSEPSLSGNLASESLDNSAGKNNMYKSDSGRSVAMDEKCSDAFLDGECFCVIDSSEHRELLLYYLENKNGTPNRIGDTQCLLPWLQRCHCPNECIIKSVSRRANERLTPSEGGEILGTDNPYSRNWNRWSASVYNKDGHVLLGNLRPSNRFIKWLLSSLIGRGFGANRCVHAYTRDHCHLKLSHSLPCLGIIHSLSQVLETSVTEHGNIDLNITRTKNTADESNPILDDLNANKTHVTCLSETLLECDLGRKGTFKNSKNGESFKVAKLKSDVSNSILKEGESTIGKDNSYEERTHQSIVRNNSSRDTTFSTIVENNSANNLTSPHLVTNHQSSRNLVGDDVPPGPAQQLHAAMKHTHSITSKCSRDSKRTKHSSFEDESVVEEDLATAIFLSKLRRGRDQGSKTSKSSVKSSGSRRRFAKERQMTYMLLCVTVAFLLSWIPPWIIYMTSFYSSSRKGLDPVLDRIIFKHLTTIQLVNFVANPIIYYVFNPTFRAKVKDLIPFLARASATAPGKS